MNQASPLLRVLRSLRFTDADPEGLRSIGEAQWPRLLGLTDRSQLTLPLGVRCREYLPPFVQQRIDGNLANNTIRRERIVEVYQRIARTLEQRGVPFVVLKGFSHWPVYCADLRHRPQYDLDLYCLPERIQEAYAAVQSLGYEPFGRSANTLDHLPPLILKTGWRAGTDYYDPEIPITIELHFRFWDAATEAFGVSGSETFWERRQPRQDGDLTYAALHPADAFSYAAWHLVRHLLRGDTRAYHVYELAHALHHTAEDHSFWRDWRDLRPSPTAETIACRLAADWFGCRVNAVIEEWMAALPEKAQQWFRMFGDSPLLALERPNKDELFLHLSLAGRFEDRVQIVRRKLLPKRPSPYIADVHVASPDLRLKLKRRMVSVAVIAQKVVHHARAVGPVLRSALRWRRAVAALPRPQSSRILRAGTEPR